MKTILPSTAGDTEAERRECFIDVRGFTLIEMLVVFAVIAILAGLFLSKAAFSSDTKIRKRVQAELAGIETAIDAYKQKRGFYPPDNTNDFSKNPLYYELVGTVYTNAPVPLFRTLADDHDVSEDAVQKFFAEPTGKPSLTGFINCKTGPDVDDARNFYRDLKDSYFREQYPQSGAQDPKALRVLGLPMKGPNGFFCPWHYNSSRPTNNPSSYDLWVEVSVGGKSKIFGNWKNE